MIRVIDRKGYITLEAAIFLPIFILALVSIVYYINIFSIMENINHSVLDEASRLASKSSVVKYAPGFINELQNRIESENSAVSEMKIDRFRYLYWDGDLDNMIALDSKYAVDLALPMGFGHEYPLTAYVKCRGFTGSKKNGDTMSFEELESEGVWDPVWIFPMSGERYHGSSCTYVRANAREMVLNAEIKRKYQPCRLCNADEIGTGSFVYCFIENGSVYHRGTCRQVDRYALEINKDEAIDKGYKPCSKCGGE